MEAFQGAPNMENYEFIRSAYTDEVKRGEYKSANWIAKIKTQIKEHPNVALIIFEVVWKGTICAGQLEDAVSFLFDLDTELHEEDFDKVMLSLYAMSKPSGLKPSWEAWAGAITAINFLHEIYGDVETASTRNLVKLTQEKAASRRREIMGQGDSKGQWNNAYCVLNEIQRYYKREKRQHLEAKLDGGAVDAVCVEALAHRLGDFHVAGSAALGGDVESDLNVQAGDDLGVGELPDVGVVAGDDAGDVLDVLNDIKVVGGGLEDERTNKLNGELIEVVRVTLNLAIQEKQWVEAANQVFELSKLNQDAKDLANILETVCSGAISEDRWQAATEIVRVFKNIPDYANVANGQLKRLKIMCLVMIFVLLHFYTEDPFNSSQIPQYAPYPGHGSCNNREFHVASTYPLPRLCPHYSDFLMSLELLTSSALDFLVFRYPYLPASNSTHFTSETTTALYCCSYSGIEGIFGSLSQNLYRLFLRRGAKIYFLRALLGQGPCFPILRSPDLGKTYRKMAERAWSFTPQLHLTANDLQEAQSHGLVYLGEARDWWNPLWKWNDNSLVARLALPAPSDLVKYDHISNIVVRKDRIAAATGIGHIAMWDRQVSVSGSRNNVDIPPCWTTTKVDSLNLDLKFLESSTAYSQCFQ
ncbi:hypothetical protein ACLOAV_008400 [Pseudogymnoascus australis]